MKAVTIRSNSRPVRHTYPNAADRRYIFQKLLDGVLTGAAILGGMTAVVFLILL